MPSLPSSPSFIARYRRPGAEADDDSSFAGASSVAASEAETDEEDGWSEGDEEVGAEEVNSWDPAVGLESEPPWTRERVPRNAVRKASSKRLARARDPSAESDPAQTYDSQHLRPAGEPPAGRGGGLLSPPDERTGLLAAVAAGGGGRRGRSSSPARGAGAGRAGQGEDGDEGWASTMLRTLQVSFWDSLPPLQLGKRSWPD